VSKEAGHGSFPLQEHQEIVWRHTEELAEARTALAEAEVSDLQEMWIILLTDSSVRGFDLT